MTGWVMITGRYPNADPSADQDQGERSDMITRFAMMVGIPFLIALVLTPWVMHLAERVGAIDHPNARKIHSRPIPRLGGVGIYLSVFLSTLVLVWMDPTHSSHWWI